jgi:hypothetical protein
MDAIMFLLSVMMELLALLILAMPPPVSVNPLLKILSVTIQRIALSIHAARN